MHSKPEEIKAALDAYRAYVAARNRRALEVYVPFIARADVEPGDWPDDQRVEETRMESLRDLVGATERDFEELGISAPGDVLARYEILAARVGLDGVTASSASTPEGTEERRRRWEEHFSAIEAALKEKSLGEVKDAITVPEELRVLAEHVDAIDGAGLPHERMSYLWWGLKDSIWRGAAAERVQTPGELGSMTGFSEEWELAGGWDAGELGEAGTFCVVYCRKDEEDDWAWRYTVLSLGDFSSWVFDTIPELLEWWRDFDEEELPVEEELDASDILAGQF